MSVWPEKNQKIKVRTKGNVSPFYRLLETERMHLFRSLDLLLRVMNQRWGKDATFGYPDSVFKFKGHNHCTFFQNMQRHLMRLNKCNS